MLSVKNISKTYGSSVILSDVSFALGKGDKAALVGSNGVGKTTLLRLIAGLEEPESGEIERQQGIEIGYLAQDTSVMGDETIIDYLKNVSGIAELDRKLDLLANQLNDPEKAHEYGETQERYDHMDGYSFTHRAQVILTGFGFSHSDISRSVSELSSGQKIKVALTGILLKGVDLLLLDEPTNNLDLPSLIWLEDYLRLSSATAIIISHDRRFLDRVAKKIMEIDRNTRKVSLTGGTYSDYIEMSLKRVARALQLYQEQQEEIARLSEEARQKKADADRGSRWQGTDNDKFVRGFKRDRAGKSGKRAKAIEKRVEQMDKLERPIEHDPLEIPLEAPENPGTLHITVSEVEAGYPSGFHIGPVNFEVAYGNRVGIMGLNGSGKSTLLKTITGTLAPLKGAVEIGSGVNLGNMMQEHEILPRELNPVEFLQQKGGLSMQDSYATLARFGFEDSQFRRYIRDLSPGGRARLILAFFSATNVNTLVLDEPTNHLDLEAVKALEEAIASYSGTIILVSHDRYFLEKANLDTVYQISEDQFSRIANYEEYILSVEKRAQNLLSSL